MFRKTRREIFVTEDHPTHVGIREIFDFAPSIKDLKDS